MRSPPGGGLQSDRIFAATLDACPRQAYLPEMSDKKKDPKVPDFADLLKAWRARLGITQAEAAQQLGISVDSIQNWEIRRYVPNGTVRALLLEKIRG